MRLLVDAGADINLPDKEGVTPLTHAKNKGFADMVQFLEKQITIRLITENKKEFMPLLLLGDEDENYINDYLARGELFALYHGDVKCVCVVTDEGNGTRWKYKILRQIIVIIVRGMPQD